MPLCINPASIYVLYDIIVLTFVLGLLSGNILSGDILSWDILSGDILSGTFCPSTVYLPPLVIKNFKHLLTQRIATFKCIVCLKTIYHSCWHIEVIISKIIEKIVVYRLTCHLERNNLLPSCQSGFRRFHSTETLLLCLLSDIYGAIDRSELTLLALFDVSATFDTVDHDILLERLHATFGLIVFFLELLSSFLSGRTLSVVHGPTRSRWVPAPYGLPRVLTLVHYCMSSIHLGSPHFWQRLKPKASFMRMI